MLHPYHRRPRGREDDSACFTEPRRLGAVANLSHVPIKGGMGTLHLRAPATFASCEDQQPGVGLIEVGK